MSANANKSLRSALSLAMYAALAFSCTNASAIAPMTGCGTATIPALQSLVAGAMLAAPSAPAAQTHKMVITVVDERTGAPITGARVYGYAQTGFQVINLPAVATNGLGTAMIVGPRATSWKMTVIAPGYQNKDFSRFATDALDNVRITLKRR